MKSYDLQQQQSRYEAEVLRHWANTASDGAHDIGHLRRVWASAKLIAMDETLVDLEVLLAACMFHDLVNLPKNAPNRTQASALSAVAARDYLREDGFALTKLDQVAHAITAHSFSANIAPQTTEARILQDADRLEALGAIGIARMFHVAGRLGGRLFDSDDPMALSRPLDDKLFALDHIQTKLGHLADTMQTTTGRAIAIERTDWLLSFRSRLLRELK